MIAPITHYDIRRYSAWITLPDGELIEHSEDHFKPAKDWLADQVATHPDSTHYGIYDEHELRFHHLSTQ